MVFSPFFLVFWKDENKYSCVKRENIVDGNLRKESDEKLLSYEELEITFNRRVYLGKIVYSGFSVKDINSYLTSVEEEEDSPQTVENAQTDTPKVPKKRKARNICSDIDEVLLSIENIDSAPPNSPPSSPRTSKERRVCDRNPPGQNPERSSPEGKIRKLERKLRKAKSRIEKLEQDLASERSLREKYKSKSKTLLKKLRTLREEKSNSVDIGNGVTLNSALLERAKLFSTSPAVLGRNVFRLAFEEAEIKGKSLFGRICNANKSFAAKPEVDPLKRDAVINYCLSVVKDDLKRSGAKFDPNSIRSKITKSLGEYIREVGYKTDNLPHGQENEEFTI